MHIRCTIFCVKYNPSLLYYENRETVKYFERLIVHCQTYPCQEVFSFAAAVEGTERSGWVVQAAVKVLVQTHQPFQLFIGLIHHRKLWTGEQTTL